MKPLFSFLVRVLILDALPGEAITRLLGTMIKRSSMQQQIVTLVGPGKKYEA
jgi:hypothetical protein